MGTGLAGAGAADTASVSEAPANATSANAPFAGSAPASATPTSAAALPARYTRNMSAISADECRLLAEKRVLVAGCGGLGGHVIDMLARLGVGALALVDADAFDETNLNRQLLANEKTLGCGKAAAAAAHIARVNGDVTAEAHEVMLTKANAHKLVAGCHCVVDAFDNVESRLILARAAHAEGVPVIYGAVAGWYGQVCTVFPGDPSFATIYRATDAASGQGVQIAEGVLPFACASTAALQVAEAVKVLLGRDGLVRNRLLMIDLLSGETDSIEL